MAEDNNSITVAQHRENVKKFGKRAQKIKQPSRAQKQSVFSHFGATIESTPYELVPELTFPSAMTTYDEMTRNESTVSEIVAKVESTITDMQFYLDCADDNPYKELIQDNLDRIGLSWLVNQCAKGFKYGFSCFEKVWRMDDRGRMVLFLYDIYQRTITDVYYYWDERTAKLQQERSNELRGSVPKAQREYLKYDLDFKDKVAWIRQNDDSGQVQLLYGGKLIWFTYQPENNLATGISILRPIYKDYLEKQRLRRLNTRSHEKKIFMDTVATLGSQVDKNNDRWNQMVQFVQNRNRMTDSGIVLAEGDTVQNLPNQTNSGSGNVIVEDMKYYDSQMLKVIFANFMDMGSQKGTSGNRSLSDNIKDTSAVMMYHLAQLVANFINDRVIKEIVARNETDKIMEIPQVKFDKQERPDYKMLSDLAKEGLLDKDPAVKKYIREGLGIPMDDSSAEATIDNPEADSQSDSLFSNRPTTEQEKELMDILHKTQRAELVR